MVTIGLSLVTQRRQIYRVGTGTWCLVRLGYSCQKWAPHEQVKVWLILEHLRGIPGLQLFEGLIQVGPRL